MAAGKFYGRLCLPSSTLCSVHPYSILIPSLEYARELENHYWPHFTDDATEAHIAAVTCLRPYKQWVTKPAMWVVRSHSRRSSTERDRSVGSADKESQLRVTYLFVTCSVKLGHHLDDAPCFNMLFQKPCSRTSTRCVFRTMKGRGQSRCVNRRLKNKSQQALGETTINNKSPCALGAYILKLGQALKQ